MNRETYTLLAELMRDTETREPQKLQRLADLLTAPGDNELKSLVHDYLEQHAGESVVDETSSEPDEPETLTMSAHDREMLQRLLGR